MKLHICATGIALVVAGCALSRTQALPPPVGLPQTRGRLAGVSDAPGRFLARAGGGTPGTGYVGVSAALLMPTGDEVAAGWSADVNYTVNFAQSGSAELSLGVLGYAVERGALDGNLRSVTIGAICQLGRAFGAARWYVGAGASFLLNDLSGMDDVDAEDALAGIVSAGVDLPLAASSALTLELRYLISRVELSAGDDLALDALATRVNYVFLF